MKGYYDYHAGSDPTPDEIMFDNLLAKALGDYLERQGRQLDALCREEGAPMPLEFQKKTTRRYQRRKSARRAAALFLAAAVGFFLMMGTVEAFRVRVINAYIDFSVETNALLVGGPSGVPSADSITFPEYIPERFNIVSTETNEDVVTIKYEKGTDWILFRQQNLKNINYHIAGFDLSDFDLKINDCPAYIFTVEDETSILWYTDDTLYRLRTTLNVEEAINIVKSVNIYN